MQAGQWSKALECYRKGLETDDIQEEFCRGMMACYGQLGQRAEALSVYQHFEKRLAAALGIEPSNKTKALRNTLIWDRRIPEEL